jgi:hypothetical protein
MTKLMEKALEAVRRLPPDSQDEIARAMLTLAGEDEPEPIDAAHPFVRRAGKLGSGTTPSLRD